MATLINRSRYTVTVRRHPNLTRTFSHEDRNGVRQYVKALRTDGHSPKVEQGDDHWYVRIRQKGHKALNFDGGSLADAEAAAARIEAERKSRLFINYTSGHRITYAELIERYANEVCPKHKGCEVERTILESFLTDLGGEYAERALALKRERAETRLDI